MGRSGLTRAGIVAAAVGVADAEGVAALSMRSVGKRLGVEAMSLYHHVANKEDLLDGMVDAVFAEFHAPEVGGAWREEMRARHHSARARTRRSSGARWPW